MFFDQIQQYIAKETKTVPTSVYFPGFGNGTEWTGGNDAEEEMTYQILLLHQKLHPVYATLATLALFLNLLVLTSYMSLSKQLRNKIPNLMFFIQALTGKIFIIYEGSMGRHGLSYWKK